MNTYLIECDRLIILGGQLSSKKFGGVRSFSLILLGQAKRLNPGIKIIQIDNLSALFTELIVAHLGKFTARSSAPLKIFVIGNLLWSLFVPFFPRRYNRSIYLHGFGVGFRNPFEFFKAILVDVITSFAVYAAGRNVRINANSTLTAAHFQGYSPGLINVVPIPPFIPSVATKSNNPPSKFQFIYIGRLVPQKNVELLVRSFANALGNPQFSNLVSGLLIVGDGPEKSKLNELLTFLPYSVSSRVFIKGCLQSQAVSEAMHQSTHFVSLNTVEPYGITFVEALQSGLHVISSPYCGALEQTSPGNITLIKDMTVNAVSEALMTSISSPYLRNRAQSTISSRANNMFTDIFSSY